MYSQTFVLILLITSLGFALTQHGDHDEQVILPDGHRAPKSNLTSKQLRSSYVIDNKLYLEKFPLRCGYPIIDESVEVLKPVFYVSRPEGDNRLEGLATKEQILRAGFQPDQKTTIIVHGYNGDWSHSHWFHHIRDLFEHYQILDKQNLIFIDWGHNRKGPYRQVAARSSIVGAYLANFIEKLEQLGANLGHIELIGHSLGAHISGFAGKRLQGRLGRITGLDAAGPCFYSKEVHSLDDRLQPTDAIVVNNVHYDEAFFGNSEKLGSNDIIINGGKFQPGCTEDISVVGSLVKKLLAKKEFNVNLSHSRPTELISLPLKGQTCQMISYDCNCYQRFLNGECATCLDTGCVRIDFDFQHGEYKPINWSPNKQRRQLTLATGDMYAPCLNHYQIKVNVDRFEHKWRFKVELVDEGGKTYLVGTSHVSPDGSFTVLMLTKGEPVRFKEARIQARDEKGYLVDLRTSVGNAIRSFDRSYRVQNLEVNYMSNEDEKVRSFYSTRLCPLRWDPIKNKKDPESTLNKFVWGESVEPFIGTTMQTNEGRLKLGRCD